MPAQSPPPRQKQTPDLLPRVSYTRAELAQMFGVSERRVKRWTLDGRIRPLRPAGNGPVLYAASEVERVLKEWQS